MKITLSRRASAFRAVAGTFYALFETSYDASEPVPTPRSSCVAFGSLAQVMGWIFASLTDYEIGFRRGADGLATTPEQCLLLWDEALRRPDSLFTQPVFLDATSGAEATIPTSSSEWLDGNMLPHAVTQLMEHGYESVATRVRCGDRVVLDLHRDAAVLAGIYGYDSRWPHIAPWRIVAAHGSGEGDPSLAPARRSGELTMPALSVAPLDGTSYLVLRMKGRRALLGSRDHLFQSFVNDLALQCEERVSGGGIQAIAAYRQALLQPMERLEGGVGIAIATRLLFGDPSHRVMAQLHHACGRSALPLSGDRIVFPLTELRRSDMVATLANLPGYALDLVCKTPMRRLKRPLQPAAPLAA